MTATATVSSMDLHPDTPLTLADDLGNHAHPPVRLILSCRGERREGYDRGSDKRSQSPRTESFIRQSMSMTPALTVPLQPCLTVLSNTQPPTGTQKNNARSGSWRLTVSRLVSGLFICGTASVLGALETYAATLLGPATWGNPSQPWGTRRLVTEDDRTLIAKYRAGSAKPILVTDFKDPTALGSQWTFISDDYLKSCRRPQNVVSTRAGLELQTLPGGNCRAKWSTGYIISRVKQKFGFFEATIKGADIDGLNNAFWLVTEDHFEIDIVELHHPNIARLTLHDNNKINGVWPPAVGFDSKFADNLSLEFHDFGVLWTPTDIIYEVDGEPIAAVRTNNSIAGAADIRFSSVLMDYAGKIPDNPVGHHMYVRSLRVYPL
jgi:hypothetical protein